MKTKEKNENNLLEALQALNAEKSIDSNVLIEAIKSSLLLACEKQYGKSDNITVEIDPTTGKLELTAMKEVVAEVERDIEQISLDDAKSIDHKYEIGDIVPVAIDSTLISRKAASDGKNTILQKIREEERRIIFEEFDAKSKHVVTGIVQRYVGKNISINLGRADGFLTENEQVKGEHFKPGDRIKVYILDVKESQRGSKISVSRTHPELVKKLFEEEVTEVADGTVEIKEISREAGSRTKIAVYSENPDVDPVGACVGVNGDRVNAIVSELGGEKIDIIEWTDNAAMLIEHALAPAKVIAVIADEDDKEAKVVVPDYQLSLAIGKEGQNARLAAKLTGYKIDIKSETQARESEDFMDFFNDEGYYDEDEYYDDDEYEDGDYDEEYEDDYNEEPEDIEEAEEEEEISEE